MPIFVSPTDQNGGSLIPAATAHMPASAASANATSATIKATTVYGVQGYNAAAYTVYVKLFDKVTAPTMGTDTPKKNLPCPPGAAFAFDLAYSFPTGLAYAVTKLPALLDSTVIAANDVLGLNIDYN